MKQTGRLAAVLGITVSCIAFVAPSAFAADVTVRPADLAAHTSWVVSPFNTATAEIGALADPVHFDGSAHLQVATAGERAQLALPLDVSLSGVAAKPLSYQVYVDPTGSDPGSVEYGVNLQLQVSGPTFTTLSFQPQLDGGAAAGAWKTFASSETGAFWRTSRAFGPFAAGSDHSLADYIAAEPSSQVNGAFLNIGTGTATLNAYTDNVSVDGNTYNFATAGSAQASLSASSTLRRREAAPITAGFTSPSDGPRIIDASVRFTIAGPASLSGKSVTLTQSGTALDLQSEGQGTYAAEFALPGGVLEPGASPTADLSLLLGRKAPCGTYTITSELLSGQVATGLSAQKTLTLACPGTPTPPPGPGSGGSGGSGGSLPATGAFGTSNLLWCAFGALGLGLVLTRVLRRRVP